ATANTFERMLDAIPEQRAVRETGDLVVERLVRELAFEVLPLAHVAEVEHHPANVSVREQVRARRLDFQPPSGTDHLDLQHLRGGAIAADQRRSSDPLPVLLGDKIEQQAMLQAGRSLSEHAA